MAVLSDADRAEVWGEYMRRFPVNGLLKSDLRAAVNALDDFMNTNAAAVNNALPAAVRANVTPSGKAAMLMLVIEQRYVRA